MALLPGPAVDRDRAALDQPLGRGARADGVETPDELVEPLSPGVGRDDDLQRFTSAT
jgi:hypothetical protein